MMEIQLREFHKYNLVPHYTKEDEEVSIYDNDIGCITVHSTDTMNEIIII